MRDRVWLLLTPAASAQTPQYTVVELTVGNTIAVGWPTTSTPAGKSSGSATVDGAAHPSTVLWARRRAHRPWRRSTASFNVGATASATTRRSRRLVQLHVRSIRRASSGTTARSRHCCERGRDPSDHGVRRQRQRHGRRRHLVRGPRAAARRRSTVAERRRRTVLPTFAPCNGCLRNDSARRHQRSGQIVGMQHGDARSRTRRAVAERHGDRPGHARRATPAPRSASTTAGTSSARHSCPSPRRPTAAPRAFLWKNGTDDRSRHPRRQHRLSTRLRHQRQRAGRRLRTRSRAAQRPTTGRGFLWQNGVMYDLTDARRAAPAGRSSTPGPSTTPARSPPPAIRAGEQPVEPIARVATARCC